MNLTFSFFCAFSPLNSAIDFLDYSFPYVLCFGLHLEETCVFELLRQDASRSLIQPVVSELFAHQPKTIRDILNWTVIEMKMSATGVKLIPNGLNLNYKWT